MIHYIDFIWEQAILQAVEGVFCAWSNLVDGSLCIEFTCNYKMKELPTVNLKYLPSFIFEIFFFLSHREDVSMEIVLDACKVPEGRKLLKSTTISKYISKLSQQVQTQCLFMKWCYIWHFDNNGWNIKGIYFFMQVQA